MFGEWLEAQMSIFSTFPQKKLVNDRRHLRRRHLPDVLARRRRRCPIVRGKAGKYGRDGESLSANLEDLRGNSTRKFARWGDAHYYHIGNLSAIVFDHEKNQKQKYRKWATRLFEDERQLRQQTYFWTKAWRQDDVGLYHDFEVPLEQLEYQIIGLTSDLYADRLLNSEGA